MRRRRAAITLSHHLIAVRDPVVKQMAEWRKRCASTIRVNAQAFNRGQPSMEVELWDVTCRY